MSLSSSGLRRAFLEYFASKGHEIVPSSSLVPVNDPTLLFTNAGMVQFKDVFLGRETRAIPRAASAQRCVRAGGKHNDLENVGYTGRHHTFFEMLGNFSFGDYFKREAIHYAWEFVTKVLELPPERLWCTVFENDDEAASIWLDEVGVSKSRFARLGAKDNFWAMGDTGPCGPCTEIFYDHGPEVAGGPPGSPDSDGDRYVEIWNLVFMQFERDERGEMTPLPKPSVDTGMGLERTAAVLQGVHSNYEIDLFVGLIRAAAQATGTQDLESKSLRVIADHIRACSFLIADGVLPGNEGRGYVLRRIIRRAIRHGYMLGQDRPFFYTLVKPLEREMGEAYPELAARREHVERVLHQEELRFAETLAQGMRLLEDAIRRVPAGGVIPGETVFRLYDTYGFPEDLTADVARERKLSIDRAGFDALMEQQRERARKASQFSMTRDGAPRLDAPTEFLGYEMLDADARVVALFDEDARAVESLEAGRRGTVVLDRTPFYAESGGQIGDTGELTTAAGASFDVTDTQKLGAAFGHLGVLTRGTLAIGEAVRATVDAERRAAIVLNHSATHLLHAALRRVLGPHVQQKGSLVAPDRLRFDFSHYEPLSAAQLEEVERLVNAEIRRNAAADIRVMGYQEAIGAGALAFFGDKYGEKVRVLKLGDFSTELCGGTHVSRAGDIGLFKIVSEGGVAAGVRRIEAVTGPGAYEWVASSDKLLKSVAGLVRGGRDEIVDKVSQILERTRSLERENEALRSKLAAGGARDLMQEVTEVAGTKVLAARIDGADNKALRDAVDRLKDKLGSGVVVLGAVDGDKVRLVAGVTKDLADRLPAGRLIGPVAERVGGRGGGRADFAQAGGNAPERLDEALGLVKEVVSSAAQSSR
ncbi:MAG TPA: alanine--tRNA ligase [Gammaproteobacteria bacterium]|nr:alanine--tRNA ligase [Gammaproteobacteria bacterium]